MKHVVITGANSGIGKAAALHFAKEGYKVIMACRDEARSQPVVEEIKAKSQNDQMDLMIVDTSSFESIRTFCEAYKNKYDQLDILIHNAAYFNHGEKYRESRDGIELTFATNVFGPYLMTKLLREHLKQSDDARILYAGSNIIKHFFNYKRTIDVDSMGGRPKDKRYHVYNMYCDSKMTLLLLTFKMAEMLEKDGINVNALQINGAKMSNATIQKVKPWWRPIAKVQNLFFPSPDYMADKYFKICTSDAYRNISGKLFNDQLSIMQPGAVEFPGYRRHAKQLLGKEFYPVLANQERLMDHIWDLCERFTGSPSVLDESHTR